MATFLANRRMPPALRARIEASLGRRRASVLPRAIVRFGVAFVVVVLVASSVARRRDTSHALERERTWLLEDLRVHAATVPPSDRARLPRIEAHVRALGAAWEGEVAAAEVPRHEPMAFVHGTVEAANDVARLAATSEGSAFVTCFVDPPRVRTEAAMLPKVRLSYAGGAFAPDVSRLGDVYVALRVLEPAWEQRVRAARDERALGALKRELDGVPFEKARRALTARWLLVMLEEPGDTRTAAELDGERPHEVRVAMIDVVSGAPLLRTRRHVDPAAWSMAARAELASGLDACALAYDLTHG